MNRADAITRPLSLHDGDGDAGTARARLVKRIETWQRVGSVMLSKWHQWFLIVELYRAELEDEGRA